MNDSNLTPGDLENSEDREERRLHLEKSRLETELARHEVGSFKSKIELEKLKTWLTFLTALVGITGLLLTFYTQQKQMRILQAQQVEDNYTKKVELLTSSTSEHAKLAAITSLLGYLREETDYGLRQRTIDLLCIEGESDSSVTIQSFIRDELVRNVPRHTLEFLASQNRDILREEGGNYLLILGPNINRDLDIQRYRQLCWNMETIRVCLNATKRLSDFDLSNVGLGYVVYEHTTRKKDSVINGENYKVTTERSIIKLEPRILIKDVVFKNVSFKAAEINGVNFADVTFDDCSFDNANMIHTRFEKCSFTGQCTFDGIRWMMNTGYYSSNLEEYFPVWTNCNINATVFRPFDTIKSEQKISDTALFKKTAWKFNSTLMNRKVSINRQGISK